MSSPLGSSLPRIAGSAVERARLTVVPRGDARTALTSRTRVPFVTLVSLLLVGGIVGLLLLNTSMQQAAFATTTLETRSTALSAEHQTLQMDLEKLRDPQLVAERAQALGMVPAVNPAFLRLSDGKVLGRPTVATAADGVRLTPPPIRKPASLTPRPMTITLPASGGDTLGSLTPGSTAGGDRTGTNGGSEPRVGQQGSRERNDTGERSER